jgi:hypothetical protein
MQRSRIGARLRRAALIAGLAAAPLGWSQDSAPEARAEPLLPWVQIAEQDGVRVEQADFASGEPPRFRGTTELEAELYEVLPVILDDSQHTQWMPGCLESRTLRRDGPISRYVYTRSDLPWPLADRDAVLRSRVVMVREGAEFTTPFETAEDASMPPMRGAVRVPLLRGSYRFEALPGGRTRVELEVQMDPGGRIPRFVLPRAGRTHAIDTLRALRAQVETTRGRYTAFMREFLARGEYERPAESASPPVAARPF